MAFKSEDFRKALKEIKCPDVSDWELMVESHGVKIYRFYRAQSKVYEYKMIGTTKITANTCAAVYMDIGYRKKWDSYVEELTYIRKGDPSVIYWDVAYPWPMSHRDYVFLRQMEKFEENNTRVWVILGRSAKANELSERERVDQKKGIIRVTDYEQSFVISDNGDGTSEVYMHYYDNPRGMIPTMVVNWAAKTGVASFLTSLEDACRNYENSRA